MNYRFFFHRRWLPVLLGLAILPALLAAGCARQGAIRDRRVVVMNFENNVPGQEAESFSRTLADMMTSGLDKYPRVAVIERQDLARMFQRIEEKPARWRDFGRKAGADYVIAGSVSKLDKMYILNARLLWTSSGEIVKGTAITRVCNREDDIHALVKAMAYNLAFQIKWLADKQDEDAKAEQGQASPAAPASASAAPRVGAPAREGGPLPAVTILK